MRSPPAVAAQLCSGGWAARGCTCKLQPAMLMPGVACTTME
jgi:hypothetical protein